MFFDSKSTFSYLRQHLHDRRSQGSHEKHTWSATAWWTSAGIFYWYCSFSGSVSRIPTRMSAPSLSTKHNLHPVYHWLPLQTHLSIHWLARTLSISIWSWAKMLVITTMITIITISLIGFHGPRENALPLPSGPYSWWCPKRRCIVSN